MLDIGKIAPDFTLSDKDGTERSLSEFRDTGHTGNCSRIPGHRSEK